MHYIGIEVVITFILFGLIYEIGFIINRIGSIVIEPIFKKFKIIHFKNDYKLFNERKKTISDYGSIITGICIG